jgi:hypothetical protein
VLWGNKRTAFADRIKVVNRQVAGCAAHLTPTTLASDLAAQLLPGWVKVGVWSALFPPALRRRSMCLASVAHHRQHAAVKARPLEGHAFGNSGRGSPGAITFAK